MALPESLKDWLVNPKKLSGLGITYIRQRLIVAYLLVMASVLGASGTFLYLFFARSLNQQLDQRLQTLAQAAAPSLDTIESKGRQSLDRDLPWRDLFFHRQQSLEWFDADGKPMAKEGMAFPRSLLRKNSIYNVHNGSPNFQQENKIRSVTIAVYTNQGKSDMIQLKGYIRASESVKEIEATLQQLELGLWLGGGTAIFLIGISSLYLTNQALKPTLKSFQQLKQFAADASHELGGPLTKIGFASEILLANPQQLKEPAALRKIEIIKTGSEQMKHLLEDLLFLARTDASSPLIRSEESIIVLHELLEQLAEHFGSVAQKQQINFQTNFRKDLRIRGDSSQLNRLFSNLLSNAFKYTYSEGEIIFSLDVAQKNAVISIEDTGMGIESKYLPHIFQRFWRTGRARKKEGLGLGLAIAKTIVQQHHGKITVSSEVNVGSCFKVYLPLDISSKGVRRLGD